MEGRVSVKILPLLLIVCMLGLLSLTELLQGPLLTGMIISFPSSDSFADVTPAAITDAQFSVLTPKTFLLLSTENNEGGVKIKSKLPLQQIQINNKVKLSVPYPTHILEKLDENLRDMSLLIHDNRYVNSQSVIPVIIRIDESVSLDEAQLRLLEILDGMPHTYVREQLPIIHGLSAYVDTGYVDTLAQESYVDKISLDLIATIALDSSVTQIQADEIWQTNDSQGNAVKGQGISIAIVDSGIDYTHQDLDGGKVTLQADFSPSTGVCGDGDDDMDAMDSHGHGTHVASIAAGDGDASNGQFVGVAPEASLWAAKVLGSGGCGFISTIIQGIEWATDPNGDLNFSDRADIISISIQADCGNCKGDDDLSLAVDNAVERGSLVVVAAGNYGAGGEEHTIKSPGVSKRALTVGAVTDFDQIADFSSRGPTGDLRIKPEVLAPGMGICASKLPGTGIGQSCGSAYITLSGTSMATPHVSGVAALLKQLNPSWTHEDLKSSLAISTVPVTGRVTERGNGRIDAKKASESTFVVNISTLAFGKVESTKNIPITITNKATVPQNITIHIQQARKREDGQFYSVVSSDKQNISLQPNANDTIIFTMNLSGEIGRYGGDVYLQGTNGENYTISYYGERKYEIITDVEGVDVAQTTFYVTNENYTQVFFRRTHRFIDVIQPGKYYLFMFNDPYFGENTFFLKSALFEINESNPMEEFAVDLNEIPSHTFRTLDDTGREMNAFQRTSSLVFVKDRATNATVLKVGITTDAANAIIRPKPVKLYNLDMSNDTRYTATYERIAQGTHTSQLCDTYACYLGSLASDTLILSAFSLDNPSTSAMTHEWRPVNDGYGPYVFSVDQRLDVLGEPPFMHTLLYAPHSPPSFTVLHPGFMGTRAQLYYPKGDWRVSFRGERNGIIERLVVKNTSTAAGSVRLFGLPIELGRLITNGTYLESTDHMIKTDYLYSGSVQKPFKLAIYKNGVLNTTWQGSSYFATVDLPDRTYTRPRNVRDLGYVITPGTHTFVLEYPDVLAGNITLESAIMTPSIDTSAPYIITMNYTPRFTYLQPFLLQFSVNDNVNTTSIVVEYNQTGSWTVTQAVQNVVDLKSYTSVIVPQQSTPLDIRITLTDGAGNSAKYTFRPLAVHGIDLAPSISPYVGTGQNTSADELNPFKFLTGSCSYSPDGGQTITNCPSISVTVSCNAQKLHSWYFYQGYMYPTDLDCETQPIVEFGGSGVFNPFTKVPGTS